MVDVSCRKRGDKWIVAMNRWQDLTDMEVNRGECIVSLQDAWPMHDWLRWALMMLVAARTRRIARGALAILQVSPPPAPLPLSNEFADMPCRLAANF